MSQRLSEQTKDCQNWVVQACRAIYLYTFARKKENEDLQRRYLEKVAESFAQLPTVTTQDIVNEYSKQFLGQPVRSSNKHEKGLIP